MNKPFEYPIKNWTEIKDHYLKGSLIIGNGASMALHFKFGFSSLKEEAEILELFNDDISKLFIEFDTYDFELILRLVWHSKLVNNHLGIVDQKIDDAYENIKTALIKVVKDVHCEHATIAVQLPILYKFTKQFSTIVSLNYDLILYWILMYGNHFNDGHKFKDCFQGDGGFRNDWEVLRTPIREEKEVTLSFYQHGNLSIFRNVKKSETKIKSDEFTGLIDAITNEWGDEKIPLFVAEGTGAKKLESIKSSPYLSTIFYEVLSKLINRNNNLVIYGWGIGEQEQHLIQQIFKKETVGKVAISTYSKNQSECHRISSLIKKTSPNVEVEFFDSQSSGCWNNP
ncbi:MAG: DUF4917 family protein [Kurthia sp.]|nr:DUF4917 family protein [Candidatus Kurthia equi]